MYRAPSFSFLDKMQIELRIGWIFAEENELYRRPNEYPNSQNRKIDFKKI